MVSTCLRGRSLLGACLEKTEENKGGKISTCSSSERHRCGMSACITLHHLLSFHVQAPLSTIPCPNVAWSRVQPHLECVGPSIIPPLQIFTQNRQVSLQKPKAESICGTLLSRAIYSYDQRGRMEPRETEADRGGTEDQGAWEPSGVCIKNQRSQQ